MSCVAHNGQTLTDRLFPIRANLKEIPEDAPSLTFGNEVYHITFEDRSKFPAFGHRYTFFLQDAVEDVPEYVVQWDSFET